MFKPAGDQEEELLSNEGGGGGGGVEAGRWDGSRAEPRLYRRRFAILAVLSLNALLSGFQWMQYGGANHVFQLYYGVSAAAVDCLSVVYMAAYVALLFPAARLLDARGLRPTLATGAALNCLGAWMKCGGARADCRGFAVAVAAQTLCAAAPPFLLGAPSRRLASAWFRPGGEAAAAGAAALLANQLGTALGFLLPPVLVPATTPPYDPAPMFYGTAGVSTAVLGLTLAAVREDRPPVPPGRLPGPPRPYGRSVLNLLGNGAFVLLLLSYGILTGAFYCVATTFSQTVTVMSKEMNVGHVGLTLVLAGVLGAALCSLWAERTKSYKTTLVVVYVLSFVSMMIFTSTEFPSINTLFFRVGALGFFLAACLPLGLEYGAEISFPESEETSSGLLSASAQAFGMAFTLVHGRLATARFCHRGNVCGNLFLCVCLLLGLLPTLYIRSELKRRNANVGVERERLQRLPVEGQI